jgi:ribosome-associated toxin RatA of RatAB toxin-antitoxin module
MPNVRSEIAIAAPLESVYALCRDIEAFPEFMEDVEEVEILEQTPERQVSRWVGAIKELHRQVKWTEEDFWNDAEHSCHFKQLEGDFTSYEGHWEFHEEGETTRVVMVIDYEYVVPLIGALIQSLLLKKMQANTDAMLAAIKAKAEP